jgi:predicted nucleic acid-binding protein
MSVFADTSALYTLMVRTEQGHAETMRTFRTLLESARPLVTTNYVVVETMALLQHRIGLDPVHDFDERIVPLLTVRWVSHELHRNGMKRFLREDRRHLSLVDCVSLELMNLEGLREVLALDPHFAEAGHRLLPARKR